VTLPEGGPPGRIFAALIRTCPERVRTRFGGGMKYAFGRDLAAARAQGRRALTAFWIVTIAEPRITLNTRTRPERRPQSLPRPLSRFPPRTLVASAFLA
jgi:hypothetical protein